MKIDHISVSRVQCYDECQAKYKFKYHLGLISDLPTPFYFTFGDIVHRIIEKHTKSRGQKSISAIKSEVLHGRSLDNESHYRLSAHINNYLRLADKIGYDGEIEWEFYYDLDPPNNRKIKGFIDRLIIKNGKASIIDYKTSKPSKWRKDHTTITKDLQLACYCYVVMKEFDISPENIRAALCYLEDAQLLPVRFSKTTLLSVPDKLTKLYKEIETADPDKVIGHVTEEGCKRCEFRNICPFWSLV